MFHYTYSKIEGTAAADKPRCKKLDGYKNKLKQNGQIAKIDGCAKRQTHMGGQRDKHIWICKMEMAWNVIIKQTRKTRKHHKQIAKHV